MSDAPILNMASPTHYANLMIRYMVATKLTSFLPSLRIANVDLPYWGITAAPVQVKDGDRVCELGAEQHFPFQHIRYLAEAMIFNRFDWIGYGQRMENFPSLATSRSLFQTDYRTGHATSEDCLVCPIRGAEILDAIHPGYTIVPDEFYEYIVEHTGLMPVFMGQAAEDNIFTRRLRKRFPRANFYLTRALSKTSRRSAKQRTSYCPSVPSRGWPLGSRRLRRSFYRCSASSTRRCFHRPISFL